MIVKEGRGWAKELRILRETFPTLRRRTPAEGLTFQDSFVDLLADLFSLSPHARHEVYFLIWESTKRLPSGLLLALGRGFPHPLEPTGAIPQDAQLNTSCCVCWETKSLKSSVKSRIPFLSQGLSPILSAGSPTTPSPDFVYVLEELSLPTTSLKGHIPTLDRLLKTGNTELEHKAQKVRDTWGFLASASSGPQGYGTFIHNRNVS